MSSSTMCNVAMSQHTKTGFTCRSSDYPDTVSGANNDIVNSTPNQMAIYIHIHIHIHIQVCASSDSLFDYSGSYEAAGTHVFY